MTGMSKMNEMDWTNLPDDCIKQILSHYKAKLRERLETYLEREREKHRLELKAALKRCR
jgi:hypothetical protein